jgi:ComEC/Rec2-related protein
VPLGLPACALALGAALGLTAGGGAAGLLAAPLLALGAASRGARVVAWSLLLGLLLGRSHALAATPPVPLSHLLRPQVQHVEGVLTGTDLPGRGRWRLELSLEAVGRPPRPLPRALSVEVVLALRGRASWRDADLSPGARVAAEARLAWRGGVLLARVHDRRALRVLASAGRLRSALARIRRRADHTLARALPPRDAGLARALLLGDRGRLDRRDRTLFRHTGQAHLLAVSGLHVGLLLAGLVGLLRLLGLGLRATWALGLLAAVFLVPFTGAPPSAVRAGLGAAAWFGARLLGRTPRGLGVLALVAVLVLVHRPAGVEALSFQLSFAAVLGILLIAPRLRVRLVRPRPVVQGLLPPRRAPLRTALSVSAAAWIVTAPLVAAHMGRFCPTGPLLALLTIPLTALLLATGSVVLAAGACPPLAAALGWGFRLAAGALRLLLEGAGHAGLQAWPVGRPTALWVALYLGALGVALARRGRASTSAALLVAVCLAALALPPGATPLVARRAEAGAPPGAYDAPAVPSLPTTPGACAGDLPTLLAFTAGLLGFALLAVRLRWLDAGGAAAAWVLGVVATWQLGAAGLAALLAPFLGATLLGRLPRAARAPPRTLRQVLCNGAPALLGLLLAASRRPDLGVPVFLGALACLGADTCATEVGVRYGGTPRALLGGRTLRRGESGGVTAVGLAASVLGAALAPAAYLFLAGGGWPRAGLMAAAGVGAGLLDSLLGGTLQFRGRHPHSGDLTEQPFVGGAPTEAVSGWRWLDNDAVNLLAGLAGGALGLALTGFA